MYLYHYLMPLLFAVINLALVHAYLFRDGLAAGRRHTRINLAGFVILAAVVFAFFAPLTYGVPLSGEQFELRQWLAFWRLEPAR
jgi:dolichyl-phosphate-mannose-protein mannosyltransferase